MREHRQGVHHQVQCRDKQHGCQWQPTCRFCGPALSNWLLIWWRVLCVKEVELLKYWGTNRSKCITEEAEFQVGLEFEDKVSKACFPRPPSEISFPFKYWKWGHSLVDSTPLIILLPWLEDLICASFRFTYEMRKVRTNKPHTAMGDKQNNMVLSPV